MRENRGYSRFQRMLALVLCVVMTAGYIPVTGSADSINPISTRSDPPTLSRHEDIYGKHTRNAGKITVGKSVSNDDAQLQQINSGLKLTDDNNFLVTMTQTAQVAGLSSKTTVPVDVVFVLDTSGSMESNNRSKNMVTAANTAIKTLMEANPQNRVAVVAFSSKNYGGGTSNNAAANVLSTLQHYSDTGSVKAASEHLIWVNSNGNKDNNNVYIKSQGTGYYRHGQKGGTNIQAGIALGAQILTSVTDTTWTNPTTGQTVTRIPFMVLLSDGQPTYTYTDETWYNPKSTSSEQGPGSSSYEGNGFLAALTAAYYKGRITEHYYNTNASQQNRCYFYTIGVQISSLNEGNDKDLAQITLNPKVYATGDNKYWNYGNSDDSTTNGWKTYWENYNASSPKDFSIRVNSTNAYGAVNNYTIKKNTITATKKYVNGIGYTGGIAYNDNYYDATNVNQLGDIFNSLVQTINQKAISAPTKVSAAPEFSGYVTFTDPIGEFMEVKNVKGIYADNILYSGGKAAEYLNNGSNSAFQNQLREILKVRLEMTASQNVDSLITQLINGRKDNTVIRDNSFTWWGKKIAASDESHVQCLAYADVTNNNLAEFIKTAEIPTVDGITPDMLCRSYLFYGTADSTLGEGQANENYLYFMVRIQQELTAPYQQTMVISIPSSLLSVDEVMITDNKDGSAVAKIISDDEPVRVIYEVGIRSDINPQNVKTVVETEMPSYADSNKDSNGNYLFYTNDWNREASTESHHRAMAKATFEAALDNPFYAYQDNTPILVKNGDTYTQYTGTSAPVGNYFYAREYYDWNNSPANADGTYNAVIKTEYIPISISAGETDIAKDSDGWYVKKGTYTSHSLVVNGEDVKKSTENPIGATIVSHPHQTESGNDAHYTVLLGNNGLLTMRYIKSKNVYQYNANGAKIDVDGKAVKIGDELLYEIQVLNTNTSASADATVIDSIPAGTVYVEGSASHGGQLIENGTQLKWQLTGLPSGTTTVSFKVKVTEDALRNAVVSIDNQATVSINNKTYVTNTTKNHPEGKLSTATDSTGGTLAENAKLKVGDYLTYTVHYVNDSSDQANVTITDVIPAGTSYVAGSATEGGSYSEGTKTITWTIQNVPAGRGGFVSFQVQVNASAKVNSGSDVLFENTASIAIGTNNPRQTNKVTNTGSVGNISLTKAITGTESTGDVFTMILSSSDKSLNGTYTVTGTSESSSITFTNGSGTLKLKSGDRVQVQGLALGTVIDVLEDTQNLPYWEDSYDKNSVTVTESTGSTETPDITVTNTFIKVPVTFQLHGRKKFTGTFPDGEYIFDFQARQCNESGEILNGGRQVSATATKGADNQEVSFLFSQREFSNPDTMYYRISENPHLNPHILSDSTEYLLKLVIRYETVGETTTNKLIAETWYKKIGVDTEWKSYDWQTTTPFEFTNSYPADATTVINGTKELSGRFVQNGEFSFELLDENCKVIANTGVVANGTSNSGTFSFPRTYSMHDLVVDGVRQNQRTFTYYVKETAKNEAGMTYDDNEYQVDVLLKLENGVLSATPTIKLGEETKPTAAFQNVFTPQETSLRLKTTKTLEGAELTEGAFTFSVYQKDADGNLMATPVASAKNKADGSVDLGLLSYIPSDLLGADNNYLSSKTFHYVLVENIPANDAPTFDPGMIYDASTKQFSVTVSIQNGAMSAVVTGAIPVEGTTDTYQVTGFTNKRAPKETSLTPVAMKTTTGEHMPDDLRFSFAVRPATVEDGKVTGYSGIAATGISNGTTPTGPNVAFSQIVYNDSHLGRESSAVFYYVMEESNASATNGVAYDQAKYVMKVTLTRNASTKALSASAQYFKLAADNTFTESVTTPTPSFTNTYNAKASVNITANKTLDGRTLQDGEFDFRLQRLQKNSDGSYTPVEGSAINGKNDGNGTITFGTLNFSCSEKILKDATLFEHVSAETQDVTKEVTNTETGEITPQTTTVVVSPEHWLVRYRMSEIKPDMPLAGVTYDETFYDITIKLYAEAQQDGNTSVWKAEWIDQPEGGITFENTYNVQTPTQVTIEATKTLTGRDLRNGEFAYNLYRVDTSGETPVEHLAAGATNNAEGKITFIRTYNTDVLNIPAGGSYDVVYHLTETDPTTGGITKVSGDYYVKVTITHDSTTASYSAAVVGYYSDMACQNEVEEAVFVNKYVPAGTSFTPTAKKQLLDKDENKLAITENQFSFTVTKVSGNDTEATGNSGACNAGDISTVSFTPISITTAGEHIYKISEVTGANHMITYSSESYYVKVVVTDDGNGKLNVTSIAYYTDEACSSQTSDVLFTNHQSNGKINVPLALKKTVHVHNSNNQEIGIHKLPADVYGFGLYDSDNKLIVSGTNTASDDNGIAGILFGDLTITLADFEARNAAEEEAAENDDPDTAVFVYTVKENPAYQNSTQTSLTVRDPNPITVTVTVSVDDYNNLTVDSVVYEKDVTVENEGMDTFVNIFRYTASDALTISGTKLLTGKQLNGETFQFELSGDGLDNPLTATNGANGSFLFTLPVFTQPGEFTYTVKEKSAAPGNGSINGTYGTDNTVFTVKVTVTSDTTGKLHAVPMYYTADNTTVGGITFTNPYEPKPVTLDLQQHVSIKKVISSETGTTMNMPLNGFQFELVGIQDSNGNSITATTDSNGVIRFPAITFSKAGLYSFYIRESAEQTKQGYVLDQNLWLAEVTVSYDAVNGKLEISDGAVKVVPAGYVVQEQTETTAEEGTEAAKPSVTFTNTYRPEGCQVTVNVSKSLTGRTLRTGEFTFRLLDGARIVAETTNQADGTVRFQIPYTGADMDGASVNTDGNVYKDFNYTIQELPGNTGGITYDETPISVEVRVTDRNGKLEAGTVSITSDKKSFANEYNPSAATAEIKATKYLGGGDLSHFKFNFTLSETDADGKVIETIQTVSNGNDGSITFAPITYTTAGVHYYTIREEGPKTRAAGDMTYDYDPIEVTVTVTDDLNGKLHAAVEYGIKTSFHNLYEGFSAPVNIVAKKVLTTNSNRTLKAGDFSFQLLNKDKGVLETVQNDAEGNITFSTMMLKFEGEVNSYTYEYFIREVKGEESGMKYDEAEKKVTVLVTRKADGNFEAAITYQDCEQGQVPTFTNSFTPVPIFVPLQAKKVLEGLNLKDKEFSFQLKDTDSKVLQTVQNDGNGNISFGAIEYTGPGTHTYTICEVEGSNKNMTYDDDTYTVTVTVTDTDGVLSADVAYPEDGIVFRNTYTSDPIRVNLGAKKRLETDSLRFLKNGEFTFQLLDENGNVLQTRTNSNLPLTRTGNVSFDAIEYTGNETGTHIYTIKEIPGKESGMTYDAAEHKVTVTVTKDMDSGELSAVVAYDTEDGKEPVFVNTFKPLSVKVDLTASKKLSGRSLKDDEFKFSVYDSKGKKQATGTNDASGKITFEALTFSKAGEYQFTVKENKGLAWYVSYDKKAYDVTVTVTDTDGVLTAKVTYPEDGITFRNVYNPSGDILPETGDYLPMALLLGVSLFSFLSLAVIFFLRKVRKHS